jgi:hypothetical protein
MISNDLIDCLSAFSACTPKGLLRRTTEDMKTTQLSLCGPDTRATDPRHIREEL